MLPNLGGPPKFRRGRQLCFNRPLCYECLVPDSAKVLRRPLTPRFYISVQVGILRVNEEFKLKTADFLYFFLQRRQGSIFPPHGGISPALRCSTLGSWLLWHLPLLVRLGGGEGAACHQVAVTLTPANLHVRGLLLLLSRHLHPQHLVGPRPRLLALQVVQQLQLVEPLGEGVLVPLVAEPTPCTSS